MARIPSMTELPSPNTRRWVARRKAAVVAAVSSGIITLEEACRRYQMSDEEFFAWQRALETFGLLGLRASCVQQHRDALPSRPPDPAPRGTLRGYLRKSLKLKLQSTPIENGGGRLSCPP
jgi:transposase-like protein